MSKVFGYPKFDERGEMVLTTYDGDYAAMQMDVRVYQMKAGETRSFCRPGKEIAVLLLHGRVSYTWETQRAEAGRRNVFTEGPWCVHASGGALHPQAVAPGFQMYTTWMIRHLEGNPWLQTDRCEDERYTWLHEV